MPHLSGIYDDKFFQEWGPNHEKYVKSAEIVAAIIHDLFRPKRLIDLGAGCGVYTNYFSMRGVEALAIDGVTPPVEHSYSVPFQVRDLTVPFENIWGHFDLALCLEVAEHIPESLSDTFVDNLLRFSDRLILSAAQPNQGGHHHVNEQPKRYWVAKLAAKGYAYNRRETGRVLTALTAAHPPYMWMVEQISVYDRVTAKTGSKDRLPFSVPAPR